ncbi:MAG: helix-turn-helix transcriptional regulator, partial [Acidimicrobiales bacterium]
FGDTGAMLFAAEAAAQAAHVLRRTDQARAALGAETRVTEFRARCEGAVTPALAYVGEAGSRLTAREREVAALAGGGLSNREIAARLSLSVRTVENQLQRVYEKLGVSGRSDLAAALEAS